MFIFEFLLSTFIVGMEQEHQQIIKSEAFSEEKK